MLSLAKQAWRSWKSARSVAVLAVIAFAFGIGSTTAIYTVIDRVLLRPLPYPHSERYVALLGKNFSQPRENTALSFPDLLEYQRRTRSFDVFGWFMPANFNLTSPGAPQYIDALVVTPSLVDHLGVNLMMGRWFREVSSEAGGAHLAVISYPLWRRLGSDRGIIGKAVTLNDQKFTVTGVAPAWFRLPVGGDLPGGRPDVWLPLDPRGRENDHQFGGYLAYARLRPGVPLRQATAEVEHIAHDIAKRRPKGSEPDTAKLETLRDVIGQDIKPTLLLLLAASGLLLLITCANVAGLLVARSVARARETAVRVALGAAQWKLALQYFLESLLVSLPGAALGVLLSLVLVRVILHLSADYAPLSEAAGPDWKVLLFALACAFLASFLASLAPLWQALRTTPNAILTNGLRASAGARTRRLSQALVVAEIALAFTLLAGSAVLLSQLTGLLGVHPGFDPDNLLTFQLTASDTRYPNTAKLAVYQKRLLTAIEGLPGVTGAAFVGHLPLAGCCYTAALFPEGSSYQIETGRGVLFLGASEGYWRTMHIPLRKGRLLSEHDTGEKPMYVLINQAAARHYWPHQEALGAFARLGGNSQNPVQIVGIVADIRNETLDAPSVPEMYLSNTLLSTNPMQFVVRSRLPEQSLLPAIRRAIHQVDASQPIHNVRLMRDIILESLSLQRASSFVTGFFALAALLLAALGIYGVVSYSVRQRTVEMGTRMALGAVGRDLLRLVVGSGLRMTLLGILIGGATVAAAVWFLLRSTVIQQVDPLTFLYSTLILAAIAFLATFFPAWRATLLSPMVAIRDEPSSAWRTTRQNFRQLFGMESGGTAEEVAYTGAPISMLTEFVDAARHAESFGQALRMSLENLQAKFLAEWVALLERTPGEQYACVADVPEGERADLAVPAAGFLLNRLKSFFAPLAITGADIAAWLRWAQESRPRYVAELEMLQEASVRLAVPLRTRDQILGVLLLGAPVGRQAYSSFEKRQLRNSAEQLALMIENAHLTDRVVEQEKLRRDVALAAEVQRRLLPEQSPHSALATFAASSLPARTVGGDYYDFLEVGDHRIAVALADVAGKGVAAALIMSVVQASLRIIASEGDVSLPQLAAKLNRFLHRSTGSSSYATFFYAQVDEQTRQLRYVNAGHNPPYLLRPNGDSEAQIDELSAGGMIIGMFPQLSYEEAVVDLKTGDVLVAFTDGVTEALDPCEEEFGEQRLKTLLRHVMHLPVDEMAARISQELKTWIAEAVQHDDLTFIIMKVN